MHGASLSSDFHRRRSTYSGRDWRTVAATIYSSMYGEHARRVAVRAGGGGGGGWRVLLLTGQEARRARRAVMTFHPSAADFLRCTEARRGPSTVTEVLPTKWKRRWTVVLATERDLPRRSVGRPADLRDEENHRAMALWRARGCLDTCSFSSPVARPPRPSLPRHRENKKERHTPGLGTRSTRAALSVRREGVVGGQDRIFAEQEAERNGPEV